MVFLVQSVTRTVLYYSQNFHKLYKTSCGSSLEQILVYVDVCAIHAKSQELLATQVGRAPLTLRRLGRLRRRLAFRRDRLGLRHLDGQRHTALSTPRSAP